MTQKIFKTNQVNPKKQSPTQIIGTWAENIAKQFLLKQQLMFITHQYRTPMGEIDLIMQDQAELVFVEVRYRKTTIFGEPYETITQSKQQRLIRSALYYQHCHPLTEYLSARFDAISISGNQLNYKITWIPNAFGVE